MKLYLYLSFRHLDVLRNNRLHFSGAVERQDPFEVNRPSVRKAPDQTPISNDDFQAELRRQYAALPEHMQALVTEEYFCEQAAQKRPAIEKQMRQRQQPKVKKLPDPKKLESLAVCRLFKSPDNPVLWERYGDNYRGFVVELDGGHSYFMHPKHKEQPQVLRPVTYSNERPSVKARVQPFPSLFYRGEGWSFEQEVRLVRPKESADKVANAGHQDFYLFNFPPGLVKQVITGCNASPEDRKQLKQLLSVDLRYKKVKQANLWLDPDLFELHVKPA